MFFSYIKKRIMKYGNSKVNNKKVVFDDESFYDKYADVDGTYYKISQHQVDYTLDYLHYKAQHEDSPMRWISINV